MILSGLEIRQHIGKEIVINPFDESRLNPNSYNLRLADELLVYNNKVLFMDEGIIMEENTPQEFFSNPKSQRLQEFLSKVL